MSDDRTFGDFEPEDAWHPDDSICEQIANLFARLDLLEGLQRAHRYGEQLAEIEHRLRPWIERRDALDDRARLRVDQLVEDLSFLRVRDGQ